MQIKSLWRPLTALVLICVGAAAALFLALLRISHLIPICIAAGILTGGAVFLCLEIRRIRKESYLYIADMNRQLTETSQSVPEHMTMPVAILNQAMEIVWYNEVFENAIAQGKDYFGKSIDEIIPTLNKQFEERDYADVLVEDAVNEAVKRSYRVTRADCQRTGGQTHMLFFQDITSYNDLRKRLFDTQTCVFLVSIDNYEDLMGSVKQSERTAVLAQLEEAFDKMLENKNSIFYRLEEDRFIILMETQYCLQIEKSHFTILDDARKIIVGGRYPLTLSIGVGRGGTNLAVNETYAHQSLDMVLGRGGDQAAVKTVSGFSYYGGVTKAVEKKSKTRYRSISIDFKKLVDACDNVYIMGHRFSDLDAVGAAAGTAFIVESFGKSAQIIVNAQATLAASLLTQLDTVHPEWFISPEAAAAAFQENDLLIIVDTYNRDILEAPEVYRMAKHLMVIDHHRKMENYLDNTTLLFHEPNASSASELVTELIQYHECRDDMPKFCAEALLAGIMLDTKNFVMETGVQTFESAAYLRTRGADPIVVKLLFAATMEAYRQRSLLVSEAQLHGRFAVAAAKEFVPDIQIIAAQTADDLLGIEGVDAAFVLYPRESLACVSARSLGKINVQRIMEKMGGGGHQTMAAAQRKDCTIEELLNDLLVLLEETETENSAEELRESQKG